MKTSFSTKVPCGKPLLDPHGKTLGYLGRVQPNWYPKGGPYGCGSWGIFPYEAIWPKHVVVKISRTYGQSHVDIILWEKCGQSHMGRIYSGQYEYHMGKHGQYCTMWAENAVSQYGENVGNRRQNMQWPIQGEVTSLNFLDNRILTPSNETSFEHIL